MLGSLNTLWLFVAFLAISLPVEQANAGAWAREKGSMFVSSVASATWPSGRAMELPDIYGSAYLERGLGKKLTLGLDIGSSDATRNDRLKTIGFVRYTVTASSAKHQLALDFGGGTFEGTGIIRLGASYGTGFESFERNSWATVEGYGLHSSALNTMVVGIDATYGISFERGKLMAQLSGFKGFDGSKTITFTPSFALDIGGQRHLEVGVTVGLQGKPDPSLKVGIWQEF